MASERALQHATELARLVGRVRRVCHGSIKSALAAHGQSVHDWQVLANVTWQGPMTQAALAEHIGMHTAGMSRLLDRLQRRGLVARVADPKDRRKVRVQLTAKGRAWYRRWRLVPMQALHAVMSRLSRDEQGTLEQLLLRLS